MTQTKQTDIVYVGVDVCKSWLDIHVQGAARSERIKNTAHALEQWLGAHVDSHLHLVVEATGGLEGVLVTISESRGIRYSIVNPKRVRDFARATGQLAKNDAIDACVLAAFGHALSPRPTQAPSVDVQVLRALVERRRDLIEQRTAERNRLKQTANEAMVEEVQKHITWLDEAVHRMDSLIDKQIVQNPAMRESADRMRSVKGVGTVTAATLIALLPELGTLGRRPIAALVGLAPFANDSGARKGHRRVWGGRSAIRAVLYMAAMVAARSNPVFKEMYQRLIALNKPVKVALTAVARKLLTVLSAMERDEAPWREKGSPT